MRIAVLADIHGNIRALEAVLADIARRAPDAVVNLGDCLSGPLEAADTAALLMDRGFVTVRGNHDRQLLDRPASAMGLSDRAADAQLGAHHRGWLARLPPTATVDGALLCHGTPVDDLTYLLETVEPQGVRLAPSELLEERLGAVTHSIVFCGHTHFPRVVTAADGRLVVNPGSVGLAAFDDTVPFSHVMETGTPHARYAVADTAQRRVELVAVEYDWSAASAVAARAGRPDWAHALATGYALRP